MASLLGIQSGEPYVMHTACENIRPCQTAHAMYYLLLSCLTQNFTYSGMYLCLHSTGMVVNNRRVLLHAFVFL